ncbi:MAG: amidase [Amaricoccus sp.]|uniref:amidase n=1 Tax=Amaricoccus sp. TaxID=1872485 RepID=UPI0039E3765F
MPAPDLTIPEAALRLRNGSLTARALAEAHLARIAALDPSLHAFALVTREAALAEADAADRALAAGDDRGPLHGIPLAVKDLIDAAALPTACGSRRSAPLAAADATVVARLRRAGAVILGKLATYEYATVGPSFDGPAPPAVNPWNPERITGGSSSGSAAAVAAGLLRASLGTDTGGSIRSPAAWCGVVGLKPTRGRVPASGVFPLSPSLDTVGPLAATVAEAALVFDAIADAGPSASAGVGQSIAGLALGYARDWFADDPALDPRVLAVIDAAVSDLSLLGAGIAEVALPRYAPLEEAGGLILDAEAYAVHRDGLAVDPRSYGRATRDSLMRGRDLTDAAVAAARRTGAEAAAAVDAVLMHHHAVVTAVNLAPAPLLAPCRSGTASWNPMRTLPFNLTGHPALSIPAGFVDGLPVGLQIVGRPGAEALICRIGAAFESATDHAVQRPQAGPPVFGQIGPETETIALP